MQRITEYKLISNHEKFVGQVFLLFFLTLFLVFPGKGFSATKTWLGTTSTAWATTTNWSGNALPGNGDNVLIPGGLVNYPIASTTINFKVLTINSTGTGGKLTISAGVFNPSQVVINAGGLLIITGGTSNVTGLTVNGTFNISGGTIVSSDVLQVNSGGVVNQSGGLVNLDANAAPNPSDNLQINAGGVYNQSDGTFILKDILPGAGTFNQTGVNALIQINRHWQMGAGSTFNCTAGTAQFTGIGAQSNFSAGTKQFCNLIIDAGVNPGFSLFASTVISVSGNFINNNANLTNTTNSTFVFNGTGNQTISSAAGTASATFGNLQIDKNSGTATLLTNCLCTGNLTVSKGSFDLGTFTCNRSAAGGVISVSSGATLLAGGTTGGITGTNFPINYSTVTLAATSTVWYNGGAQTIPVLAYGNLSLSGNGGAVIKTLPVTALTLLSNLTTTAGTSTSVTCNAGAAINVGGNISIGSGTIINGSTFTHTINGNYINAGTYNSSGITYIKGNLSGSGTFNAANATVELNGVSLQTVGANIFSSNILRTLNVNNPAGVLLAGAVNVTGIVKVVQGDFNSVGFLTLVSTATQTALIDGTGNGSVSGNVIMQQYRASGFGYKYFSSPFVAATVNEFADDLNLAASFPAFYRYNESSLATGWVNYTNPSGVLVPLTGYAANFGNSSAAITVDVTGVVNNGNKSISLSNTNKPFTTGFNLVGNPYPSPVNWNTAAGWNRVNIDNAIYYFDASNSDQYGGTYSTYINGISSNGIAGSIIAPMQGFFVHVSNGTFPVSGSIQVNNAARTLNLAPVYHRATQNDIRPIVRLQAGDVNGSGNDNLVVYFEEGATPFFEKTTDALKLKNTDEGVPDFYSLSAESSQLSINAMPLAINEKMVIPLGIDLKKSGEIKLRCSLIENMPDSLHLYLSDAQQRINQDLKVNPDYIVKLENGIINNRFSLIFSSTELPYITDTDNFGAYSNDGTIYIYVNPGESEYGKLSISDVQGRVLFQKDYYSEGHHTISSAFNNGIYIVSFYTSQSSYSKKLFLSHE